MEELILLPGASPASLLVQPGKKRARRMTATSGQKCAELLQKPSRLGSVVRTLLESTEWHSRKSCLTWKVKVTKCKRLKFRLALSELLTLDTGLGYWPTMLTSANGKRADLQLPTRGQVALLHVVLKDAVDTGQLSLENYQDAGSLRATLNPCWVNLVMGYPIGWTRLEEWETP